MAHNLDITHGQASFVAAREDAWHRLGVTLPDAFNAEAALRYGLLADWNLRKAPLVAHDTDGSPVPVEAQFAIVRDNPVTHTPESLGVVGDRYHILQNEELIGLLEALVDESGAHFETAGAIDGGRRVFVTMKLPGHISVGGADRVDQYIAAMTSHDGTASTSVLVTPVRIVCQNTLNMAFNNNSGVFRARHVRSSQARLVGEARRALDLSFQYLDGFQQEAEKLLNEELSDNTFMDIIWSEFGPSEDAPPHTRTRRENQVSEMEYLFTTARTQAAIRNTRWAGVQALTEWFDHMSPVRGADPDTLRARKAIVDPAFKNRALALFSS